ncbi:MAG TPA: glycosyltransferase family 39 protein [Thermoanaerobaculia bacterium]|nr:glycosyltransferase family 39 protein [Thermoanaerobaculia bacterium]
MEATETPYLPLAPVSTRLRAAVQQISVPALLGFVLVAVARALTLPRSLWEMDEFLFSGAVGRFAPLNHRPHPPGYPLTVGLGKLFALVFQNHFVSLVALAVVSSLVGYWALVSAFRRIAGEPQAERVAIAGALLFQLSPVMLVQGTLPMSDPPALMFLALALAAAAALWENGGVWAAAGLGAAASAAIGCRPQLAVAVLPMLVVVLWRVPETRRRWEALTAFTLVSVVWFVPLVVAAGGPSGFLAYEMKQAAYVAVHDAKISRGGRGILSLVTRFVAHPWGPKWLSLPVLALAAVGIVVLVRRRRAAALPLAVLSAIQLAICLTVTDPADAVRYALPAVLGVALAAVVGSEAAARRFRVPAAAWLVPALVVAGGAVYAGPLLAARSTSPAPPIQAALWAHKHLAAGTGILVQDDLAPHAHYLLRGFDLSPVDAGLQGYARRPYAPLWLFTEGESAWPGAVTFRWPDTDAYGKLTRNHYRIVSLSPIPADARYQVVRGVSPYEPSVQAPRWRWLDADAVLRVFPRGIRALAVTLGLPMASPLASNKVVVSVNGTSVTTVELGRGAERQIELPMQGDGRADVGFRSDRSFVPSQEGLGDDSRHLAVQLLAVKRIPR